MIGFSAPAASTPLETGAPIAIGGVEIGKVVLSMFSPGRQEIIGLARVRPDLVAPKLSITVGSDAVPATTLAAPYFLPISWKTR